MARKPEKAERDLVQLTLVSNHYASQLLRTVAQVRSISSGRTVSMAEVFRTLIERAAPGLEDEIREVLGERGLATLNAARRKDLERGAGEAEDEGR